MEIGIVILNYLNWTDTVECIESLKKQTDQDFQIVVVDNASNNESIDELRKRYENSEKVHLLCNESNLGFAKGNNTGILYCKKILGITNVLVINNDIIFTDLAYIEFLKNIDIGSSIGVVGTRITGADGQNQNPHYFNPSFKAVFREFSLPLLRKYRLERIIEIARKIKKYNHKSVNKVIITAKKGENYVLHGSVFYLTENYLNHINGLYPETFLYYEEEILGLVCKKLGLKMDYMDNADIYHKEDQSSNLSFNNLEGVKYKFARKSVRTGLKVSLMTKENIINKINNYSYEFIAEKKKKVKKYYL